MTAGWPDKPRALVSYAYIADDWTPPAGVDLLIDSGAFTAYTTGKRIDLDAYMQYLDTHRGRYRAAFALDVIGDADGSLANYRIMRRSLPDSVEIIPTWHVTSGWEHYTALIGSGAPRIALGGAVTYSNQRTSLMRTFIRAHQLAREAGVKLHGLGQTGNSVARLPWESVDSSSWTYPRQYPMLLLAKRNGDIVSIKRGQDLTAANTALVKRYGLDPLIVRSPRATIPARVGRDTANRRIEEFALTAARAYTYLEATHPTGARVHLACSPDEIDRYVVPAWRQAPPYPVSAS